MTINIRLLRTGVEAVDRALSSIVDGLRPLFSSLFAETLELQVSRDAAPATPTGFRIFKNIGPLTRDIALVAGDINVVPHKLGRAARGRIITAQSADARVWDFQFSANSPPYDDETKYVALECSNDVTVSLVLF